MHAKRFEKGSQWPVGFRVVRGASRHIATHGTCPLVGVCRAVDVLPLDSAPTDPTATVSTAALRSLAGLAAVPEARASMATVLAAAAATSAAVPSSAACGLCGDLLRCCRLSRCHAAVDAALVAVSYMAAAPELQAALLRHGALQVLVPLVLQYDSTLPNPVRVRCV